MAELKDYEGMRFNARQLAQIRYGLEKGLDVSVYANPKFNWEQMNQIRMGLAEGADIRVYADPKFNADQMRQIRFGLEYGVDVTQYADPKYDENQMWQIHFGLLSGVDVSIYADPKYTGDQMDEIRGRLAAGEDIELTEPKAEEKEITSPDQLLEYQTEQEPDYSLSKDEAELLLSYLEGHDYCIGAHNDVMFREDSYGFIRREPYSIEDLVDDCRRWNANLIATEEKKETRDESTLAAYKADGAKLDQIYHRKPSIKKLESMFHDRTESGERNEPKPEQTESVRRGRSR